MAQTELDRVLGPFLADGHLLENIYITRVDQPGKTPRSLADIITEAFA